MGVSPAAVAAAWRSMTISPNRSVCCVLMRPCRTSSSTARNSAIMARLISIARVVRRAQNGSLQTYLVYVFAAVLVALVLAR